MPRRLIAFNRSYYNPAVHRLAAWLPSMGVMYHTGRRSGREHRTVLNVFRRQSQYVIAIAYGRDSDWVRNVIAKGSCDVVKMGKRLHLVDPRIVVDDSRRLLPPPWRPLLRWLRISEFLVLRLDTGSAAQSA
jgi:deazaflavin-dependent oxidoreductase (nitroreductase family)